jgi:hypothetical protein
MFLVRSAFWLTVAFIAIGPKNVDIGAVAGDLSAQAIAAGSELVVDHVLNAECTTLECVGGKAIIATTLKTIPSSDPSMQDSMSDSSVPFPRPRPSFRMG